MPEFEGLHSVDRSRYNWSFTGNWTHVRGLDASSTRRSRATGSSRSTCSSGCTSSSRPTSGCRPTSTSSARRRRLHAAASASAAIRASRRRRSSGDTATNMQGTVNLTRSGARIRCAAASTSRRPSASADRAATPRAADVQQRVHAAGQRQSAAHAEQPRAVPGGVHARHSDVRRRRPSSRPATSATTSSRPSGRTRGASAT